MSPQGWRIFNRLMWDDCTVEATSLTGAVSRMSFSPCVVRKQTKGRVTTAMNAASGEEIPGISAGWSGNSYLVSQTDRDLPVKFLLYDPPKPIDLTNGTEICFGN